MLIWIAAVAVVIYGVESLTVGIPPFANPGDTTTQGVKVTGTPIDTSGGRDNLFLFATVVTQNGDPIEKLTLGNFTLKETIKGVTTRVSPRSLTTSEISGEPISLNVARKNRQSHCEPHKIRLTRYQVPARACRSSSL